MVEMWISKPSDVIFSQKMTTLYIWLLFFFYFSNFLPRSKMVEKMKLVWSHADMS